MRHHALTSRLGASVPHPAPSPHGRFAAFLSPLGKRLALALVLFLLFPIPQLLAQSSNAAVQGRVVVQGRGALGDAPVLARNTETGMEWTATTNKDGYYFFLSIPPGTYEIRFEHEGFEPQIKLAKMFIGQKVDINFEVTPGGISEEVTVTAEIQATDLTKSDLSIPIRNEQMEKLPLNGRNFLEVATLAPGTKPAAGGASGSGLTTGASTASSLGFYVDGSDRKNEIVDGGMVGQFISSSNAFPLSAIREYRVVTQLYKAEFAKASGGVVTAATKSGTNDLNGEVFFTYRDKDLNSKNAFASEKPAYERNQMGFAVGGPIVKDKLHYFLAYEDTQVDEFYISAPTGDFADQGGNFPMPQKSKLGFLRLTYQPSPEHYFDISLDDRDESNTAYWLWWAQPYTQDRGLDFTNDVTNISAKYQLVAGTALHEIRFNSQDYGWATATLAQPGPGLRYPSIHIGPFSHAPQDWAQERYSLNYDVSVGLGNHFIKAGVSAQRLRYQAEQQLFLNPQFDFETDTATVPYNASIGVGDPGVAKYNTQYGLFIQDDWKVNDKLTLSMGIRYDYETNMLNNDFVTPADVRADLTPYFDERYFSDGSNRDPFTGALQPRLGLSYDISGDGTRFLTAGVGIFYDRTIWNVASDEALRYTYKIFNIRFSEDGANNSLVWDDAYFERDNLLDLIASGETDPPEVFLIPDDLKPPKTIQFSVGYRQKIQDATLSVSYVGVRGSNETAVYDANANGQIPGYGKVNVWTDEGNSWFDAFYLFFDRPYKDGWFGQVSYTLGWADNESDSLYHGYWRYTSEDMLERAPALTDERHRVSVNVGFDLPWKMQVSGWGTYATGTPYEVIVGSDVNGDGFVNNDYPEGEGRNSGRKDATKVLNLRLSKKVTLRQIGLNVYVDAFNVFDWENYTSYINNQQSASFGQASAAGDPRQIQVGGTFTF
ncbi:TonB-dependent receptor [Sulfidibacter corallicola]|uniref:TonB-dependent receptor n=1 Tax=Sulfidibacter corallicola TaxID=2818388 RepID=A0A8A4TU58_SULCO|nr:TonB-dependent receptor [Sulfidibacter corallicola]QTD53506.1 TonB-dependent receptor [Sulfidibacter corallicola]